MAYQYSTQEREQSPTLLPDFETFQGWPYECRDCGAAMPNVVDSYGGLLPDQTDGCPECGSVQPAHCPSGKRAWFYAWLDGGLDCWSSDPIGPFATEAEAIAAARAEMDVCEHGKGADDTCEICD